MAFDDIEKLKERLAKDPGSKLFVPLSEEYRKAGMFDEAIDVLQKGLESQPSYMSARVSLGKIYLEKDMTAEARAEFEKVIKAIPDNLFAHKKLAEIYKEQGEPEASIDEYKIVLKLNPLDEDARINLESLMADPESYRQPQPPEDIPEETLEAEEEVPASAMEIPEQEVEEVFEEPAYEVNDTSIAPEGQEFEAFKSSMMAEKLDMPRKKEKIDSPMFFTGDDPGETELSEADETVILRPAHGFSEPELLKEEPSERPVAESPEPLIEAEIQEEVVESRSVSLENDGSGTKDTPDSAIADNLSELQRAEEYIANSRFSAAIAVYENLLRGNGQDKRVLQKLEELRIYLKMIGRDKKEIVSAMEKLLSGIHKRKNEFYRSA